jgi:hypothetical protein
MQFDVHNQRINKNKETQLYFILLIFSHDPLQQFLLNNRFKIIDLIS